MRQVVLAVLDRAVGAYQRPFFAPSVGAAVRAFRDEVNRKESEMNRHPGDYDLYQLGSWDELTGDYHQLGQKELVARGSQMFEGLAEPRGQGSLPLDSVN